MKNMDRRDFIKLAGGTIATYSMPVELSASEKIDDYKALVVIKLQGGNDSLNTFIPADATSGVTTGYASYAKNRHSYLRMKNIDLSHKLNIVNGELKLLPNEQNPYYIAPTGNIEVDIGKGGKVSFPTNAAYTSGYYLHGGVFQNKIATNPLMPELAHLINSGKCAIVQNVGSIIVKATKEQYKADPSLYPTSFGSHLEATKYYSTGQAGSITYPTGWLGRLADKWGYINQDPIYTMNTNLSTYGSDPLQFSQGSSVLTVSYNGPVPLYRGSDFVALRKELDSVNRRNLFKRLFNKKRATSYFQNETLVKDFKSVSGTNDPFSGLKNAYGYPLFGFESLTDTNLGKGYRFDLYKYYVKYFETVAKLIAIGKQKGIKRQVFVIPLVAFDSHYTMTTRHAQLLRSLSHSLGAFQKAIDHIGMSNSVTTFSVSEFGRTAVTNSRGSDHGWGATHFVLGGAVKPGNYGEFPDLTPGGKDDVSVKGRIIPTTSFSQYYGTILKWFGADESELNDGLGAVLPELKNFDEKDLGFMKA